MGWGRGGNANCYALVIQTRICLPPDSMSSRKTTFLLYHCSSKHFPKWNRNRLTVNVPGTEECTASGTNSESICRQVTPPPQLQPPLRHHVTVIKVFLLLFFFLAALACFPDSPSRRLHAAWQCTPGECLSRCASEMTRSVSKVTWRPVDVLLTPKGVHIYMCCSLQCHPSSSTSKNLLATASRYYQYRGFFF